MFHVGRFDPRAAEKAATAAAAVSSENKTKGGADADANADTKKKRRSKQKTEQGVSKRMGDAGMSKRKRRVGDNDGDENEDEDKDEQSKKTKTTLSSCGRNVNDDDSVVARRKGGALSGSENRVDGEDGDQLGDGVRNADEKDETPKVDPETSTSASPPINNDGSWSSSSVPSSSSSSSDDDDGRSEADDNDDGDRSQSRPAAVLRVIAPRQHNPDGDGTSGGAMNIRRRRGRGGMEDEAIDDFDVVDAEGDVEPPASDEHRRYRRRNGGGAPRADAIDPEAVRALRLTRLPLEEVASSEHWNLPPFLAKNLVEDAGCESFFPIQCLVAPDVLESERHAGLRGARDVCCHAPTGSGKTLAFVVPVLSALHDRSGRRRAGAGGGRRLRALVVLPGRDLARQVYDVFVKYARGSNIKIGLAVGGRGGCGGGKSSDLDLAAERRALVAGSTDIDDCGGDGERRDKDGKPVRRRRAGGLADAETLRSRCRFDPTDVAAALEAFDGTVARGCNDDDRRRTGSDPEHEIGGGKPPYPLGGRSAIDVLVATPGRLVDHLDNTPGFTLQHLRFLVVDEADKLVNQPYQNWVGRVLEAADASIRFKGEGGASALAKYTVAPLRRATDGLSYVVDPITHRITTARGGGGKTAGATAGGPPTVKTSGHGESLPLGGLIGLGPGGVCGRPVPLRKMLFSATLTRDPRKLARLGLVNPKHFDAHRLRRAAEEAAASGSGDEDSNAGDATAPQEADSAAIVGKYAVPERLKECMVECTAEQKPLVLLALLLDEERRGAGDRGNDEEGASTSSTRASTIVFTSSLDSTHRLTRLLQLLWEAGGHGPAASIAEFSSSMNARQRAALLRRCSDAGGTIRRRDRERVAVLVCSDGMSRGMDLPAVSTVVNYDVPQYAKTYVHRCGRTARAGREGKAVSVLKGGQVGQFRKMRGLIDGGSLKPMGINKDLVKGVLPTYKACIRALKDVINAEKNGELHPSSPLDVSKWVSN